MQVGDVHIAQGDPSAAGSFVRYLESEGFRLRGNADAYVRTYGTFGIEEARELASRASVRSLSGEGRTFVLAMRDMTSEAQNALLKTLEEPSAGARFFFLIPAPDSLLPTLLSRAQRMQIFLSEQTVRIDARRFLASRPAKRIEMLKSLLEKDDDTQQKAGDIVHLLSSLETELASRVRERGVENGLTAIYRARKYICDKGAHSKSLVEQVALLMPVVQ